MFDMYTRSVHEVSVEEMGSVQLLLMVVVPFLEE